MIQDIHKAAEEGNLDLVRQAIQDDPDSVNLASPTGNLPLHCAALQSQLDAVRLLIELGADVNAKGGRGRTPLHCAAASGAAEIIAALLENNAEIESKDDRGQSPLDTAVHHVEIGRPETQQVVDVLLNSGAYYGLDAAVTQSDHSRVADLLASEPDLLNQLPQQDVIRIIHGAIDDARIMEALLEHGGDANACDPKSAFATAPITRVESPEVAEVLLRHGADPNALSSDGKTRLQAARKYKEAAMVKVLELSSVSGRKRSSRSSQKTKVSTQSKGEVKKRTKKNH